MTKNEFIALIVQDVVVDYPFGRELQRWSMKNFYIDGNGEVKHNRLTLIMDAFIASIISGRTPRGVRGLKCLASSCALLPICTSHPSRGAWIEMAPCRF